MIETTHGAITVRIDRAPLRFATNIWIFRKGDPVFLLQPRSKIRGFEYVWEAVDPAKDYGDRPTMTMEDGIGEALAAALNGYLPPDARTERHLDDARGLADRLLRIIETDFRSDRS